jgi:hypothetical protein
MADGFWIDALRLRGFYEKEIYEVCATMTSLA